jgi:predicted peroxiredoxin
MLESGVHACLGAAAAAGVAAGTGEAREGEAAAPPQRYLLVGLCGSENPTRSNFPFVWAAALKESGQEVRIELAGDATVMMRTTVANNVTAVGWPPFREALAKVIDHKIPIFV